MQKDNSSISKIIIKYILDNKQVIGLNKKQIQVLLKNTPKTIMNVGESNLYKNSLITGKDKKIYKVNYNKESNWFAPLNWQRQPKWIFGQMNFEYNISKTEKENFLWLLKKIGLKEFIRFLFNLVPSTDNIIIIDRLISKLDNYNTSLFDFEFQDIESDILEKFWEKNTWFVYVDGYKLIQIQMPASKIRSSSLVARIDSRKLAEYSKKVKKSNEIWGISVEVAICKKYNIGIPSEYSNRYSDELVEEAIEALDKMDNILNFTKCLATKRIGQKKSSTDFMANDIKISVKSNFNSNSKVCSPEIGQPGLEQGLKYYNSIFERKIQKEELSKNGMYEFKEQFIENINIIMQNQVKHLFSEDYILYLKKSKTKIQTFFINTIKKDFIFFKNKFDFSRSAKEWKESISIRYDGISIAEMQLHLNRSPFKFRINLLNLLIILKKMVNS